MVFVDKFVVIKDLYGFRFLVMGRMLDLTLKTTKRNFGFEDTRVLVAPPHSTLDWIIFCSLKTGVHDENVFAYSLKIMFLGLNSPNSVEVVSMDYLLIKSIVWLLIRRNNGA